MRTYYVAKTPNSGFVGTHTLEEIAVRLRNGELQGNYVATEFSGATFAELTQSNAIWDTLAQLLRNESIPLSLPSPSSTPAQHSELELLQQLVNINLKQLYWIRVVGIIILFSWLVSQFYSCSRQP